MQQDVMNNPLGSSNTKNGQQT